MRTIVGAAEAEQHLARLQQSEPDVRVVEAGTDKASTLANFARDLRLPDWFGHNYDALYDCLLGLDLDGEHPIDIVVDHAKNLRRENRAVYDTLLTVLNDAAAERADLRVTVLRR